MSSLWKALSNTIMSIVNAAKRGAEKGCVKNVYRRYAVKWILMDVIVKSRKKREVVGPTHKRDDRPPIARITP